VTNYLQLALTQKIFLFSDNIRLSTPQALPPSRPGCPLSHPNKLSFLTIFKFKQHTIPVASPQFDQEND
jgi:hypothetical protein